MVETKLTHGMQSFGSMRGVSGHQHNPFAGKKKTESDIEIVILILFCVNDEIPYLHGLSYSAISCTISCCVRTILSSCYSWAS